MSEYDDDLMDAELENLNAENFDLKDTVKWLQRQVTQLQQTLELKNKEIAEIEQQVAQLQQTLQYREKEIEELASGMALLSAQHEAEMAIANDREKRLRDEVTHYNTVIAVIAGAIGSKQQ